MTRPKVTVVLVVDVTEGNLEERVNAPFEGKTLPTIKSIEDQTWPHELLIMRNVDWYPPEWVLVEALKQVTTDWVAIIEDGDVWPEDYLQGQMPQAIEQGAHTVMLTGPKGILLDRTRSPLSPNWKDNS